MNKLRVLVACEFSQVVTKAFRAKGHEAYSCDILPTEGNPDWHIQDDVLKHLDDGWDMMIAHPPCTYLANSGVQHLHKDPQRWSELAEGSKFFLSLLNADIPKRAIENPIPHKYAELPPYSQLVQPRYFGGEGDKATCLWLVNLPPLMATYIYPKGKRYIDKNGRPNGSYWYQILTPKNRAYERSRTFPQIAEAMAIQWGSL